MLTLSNFGKNSILLTALTLSSLSLNAEAASMNVNLSIGSSGWVSNYESTSLDPRFNYGSMPSILTSGANFESANVGWNTLGYNDSSWATYTGGWQPGDGSRSPMYLRKTFTLGTPEAGSDFYIEVDDDSMVWINGVLVPALDDHSNSYNGGRYADITSFLMPGSNVIAIKADNTPGGGYHIGFAGTAYSSEVASVPVPAAAWLFGSGLLGMAGLRRKKNA